jgi:hypothetical protein
MQITRLAITAFITLLISSITISQSLPIPRNIENSFKKGTRSMDGKPGRNYWQNSADYTLHIDFSPSTRLLSGTVEIVYSNNSPDTLRQVWFKLYPNLYKKGAILSRTISPKDVGEGVIIDSMWVIDKQIAKKNIAINGTNMVIGQLSIAPGTKTKFRISYHYTVNKGSHIRTGEIDSNSHFIAYFFPRVAVYDDIDGWNRLPYNGNLEFYNDFSNFDSYITVPKDFIVWATGDLQNCNEVLMPGYCDRIEQAEKNDAIINIIDTTDDRTKITADKAFNTWHYKASNVTDFTFASSDHYIWQSSSLVVDSSTKRRTRVDAAFNPIHQDYFWVAGDARRTVEVMSHIFPKWPFPYPHVTVFDGLDQMEYPMMVNDNPVEDRQESIMLTDHEVFHMMFPFYVGINETKYAWMDEGWATIGEWIVSPYIDSTIVDDYGVLPTERHMGTEYDLPIITPSTETNFSYFTNSYPEPAMGYLFVKDMLGDSLFLKALHFYIRNWNGKHPMPLDFFNSMNTGSGKNLNWFWKRWFYDEGYADLAITSVIQKLKAYNITITLKGNKPVPVDLFITFADKTTTKVHRSIAAWEKGNKNIVISIPVNKKIQKIELGSTWVPDVNKADNVYELN